jgi:hypothetical protein
MRSVTILFYALATFLLGLIATASGGYLVLAQMMGAQLESTGFGPQTYPTEPYRSILMGVTLAFSVVFLILALLSAFGIGESRGGHSEDE